MLVISACQVTRAQEADVTTVADNVDDESTSSGEEAYGLADIFKKFVHKGSAAPPPDMK